MMGLSRVALALCFTMASIGWCEGMMEAWCNITADSGRAGDPIQGTVHFTQETLDSDLTLNVSLSGFNTVDDVDQHGFHVHTSPNLTVECKAAGGHYNPEGKLHGAPADPERHIGDLGNVMEDADGKVNTVFTDSRAKLGGQYSILNRAIVVHEREDDLGRGVANDSKTTGAAGARLGCCVITQVQGSAFETAGAAMPSPTFLAVTLLMVIGTLLQG